MAACQGGGGAAAQPEEQGGNESEEEEGGARLQRCTVVGEANVGGSGKIGGHGLRRAAAAWRDGEQGKVSAKSGKPFRENRRNAKRPDEEVEEEGLDADCKGGEEGGEGGLGAGWACGVMGCSREVRKCGRSGELKGKKM